MNYYEHHLGDYLRDTAHLSLIEDGAYRRLIDLYYTREAPLPASVDAICRLARSHSQEDETAIRAVLDEFFALSDDGYRHKRCDEEIKKFQDKSGKARNSANARWDAKRVQSNGNADAMRTHSEGNALQTPDTSHHTEGAKAPTVRGSKRCPEGFQPDRDFALHEIPDLDVDREIQKFKDWEFKTARKDWPACWRTWIGNARDRKQYAKKSNGIDPREWR